MQSFVLLLIFISLSYIFKFSLNAEVIFKRHKRAIVKDVRFKWKTFPIKYQILPNVSDLFIEMALEQIQEETCISFEHVENIAHEGIKFIIGNSYKTKLGKNLEIDKAHRIYISRNNVNLLIPIQRLVLRALGVDYEHNRPDRDKYVKINHNNLDQRYLQYTNKKSANAFETYGIGYDYNSRMQLSFNEWSKNGFQTFAAKKQNYNYLPGRSNYCTFNDIKLLNKHYCRNSCKQSKPKVCLNYGYQDPNNCSKCKCPFFYDGIHCEKYKTSEFEFCGKTILIAKNYLQKISFHVTKPCFYRIHAEKGKRIRIKFLTRHPENLKNCRLDNGLEIAYLSDKSISGALFCGKIEQNEFLSDNNLVLIRYYHPSNAFSPVLAYSQVSSFCPSTKRIFTQANKPFLKRSNTI